MKGPSALAIKGILYRKYPDDFIVIYNIFIYIYIIYIVYIIYIICIVFEIYISKYFNDFIVIRNILIIDYIYNVYMYILYRLVVEMKMENILY
jgi:hypothetical protein